jgi:electron transfer flavoprotein beta subunit
VKIGVCAKVSADADARVKTNADGSGVDLSDVKLTISDYDEFAVEEAVRTKEKHGGEIVSFTVGTAKHDKVLRAGCLALGVDRSVLVTDDTTDPLSIAKLLAAAVGPESCDVVFTGKSTIDAQTFQVSSMLGELLGWPVVFQVTELEFDGNTFKATRNLDAGVRQVVTGQLPAIISCEDGLNTVRYAKLPAIMKAKRNPMSKVTAADLGVDTSATPTNSGNYAPPPSRPSGRILEGDTDAVVAQLVQLLRDEAKVI